ncbi:hypothetical protein D3P08_12510 [Paenibacillus nanensis]|uniref:Uncharacterized protein n=1 Tax=Paenibacillus nanensis TaxID=393251 RepID=A0A3A1UWB6_9BACL|nr:hypothetical protein [Paenibacillus nanensis]RIX52817.1 hypothetical protein D3P08_12510 [Paenibacillus nanensis]
MSEYTRVIRGIERSADFMKARPASRYDAYKLTAYERAAGAARLERKQPFDLAADSAAAWLSIARSAQNRLEGMMKELGRDRKIENPSFLLESVGQLVEWLNEWELGYKQYKEMLKPEIWGAVELALRHPAMDALGIGRGNDGRFYSRGGFASRYSQPKEIANAEGMAYGKSFTEAAAREQELAPYRRLLLGSEGLLMDLKRAMSYAEQQRPVDLIRLSFASAYPYALYYGASQAYWPLPPRGAVINKFV